MQADAVEALRSAPLDQLLHDASGDSPAPEFGPHIDVENPGPPWLQPVYRPRPRANYDATAADHSGALYFCEYGVVSPVRQRAGKVFTGYLYQPAKLLWIAITHIPEHLNAMLQDSFNIA